MTELDSVNILAYRGRLTFEIIEELLEKFKRNLESFEMELVIRKRLYAILVECLENTYRHTTTSLEKIMNHQQVELVLNQQGEIFNLEIGNYVVNKNVDDLIEKIDLVNSLDFVGLNRLYRSSISKARISDKGGAGLGIIEIARNSRQKIIYQVTKENNDFSFFKFRISISKNPNKER